MDAEPVGEWRPRGLRRRKASSRRVLQPSRRRHFQLRIRPPPRCPAPHNGRRYCPPPRGGRASARAVRVTYLTHTPDEVADTLKVHVSTVYRLIDDDKLDAISVRSRWRITDESLRRFMGLAPMALMEDDGHTYSVTGCEERS
ncbi:MAG: helix-turn-helix domain-containing protein [Chloroflexi bacterium]|nr:helix-turn-helix domain-containing protein [Chloroflexota bacterium]